MSKTLCKVWGSSLLAFTLASSMAVADSIHYVSSSSEVAPHLKLALAVNTQDPFVRLPPANHRNREQPRILFLQLGEVQKSSIFEKGSFLDIVMSFIEIHIFNVRHEHSPFCEREPQIYTCQ